MGRKHLSNPRKNAERKHSNPEQRSTVACTVSVQMVAEPSQGTNENPNVKEFCQNTQALRIVNSFCKDIARGNCRGSKSSTLNIDKENLVLPKRQQVRAKK